ncbi:MAG: metal ABC transporter permease [Bradymonadales bacterium]|nr:metal ABC transporter permease [Bradymonadales bacterium]
MSRFSRFLRSSFLWKSPIFVAVVASLILGFVGIYVVLRRIVFVTACLANVSGVGVALGLLLGLESQHQVMSESTAWYQDILGLFGFSLLITSLAAAGFAWWRESKRVSSESLLGVAYLVTSALLVLLAGYLNQATHDIDNIIFGSGVVVEPSQVIIVPLFAAAILVVHLILRKDFLFVSFDPVTARAVRHPVHALDMVLLVTIGLAIAISTRAIGALPVFAFIVLPPLTALLLTDRIALVFVIAPFLGALAAAGGYFTAFMLAWPIGPTMTLCCTVLLAIAWLRSLVRRVAM